GKLKQRPGRGGENGVADHDRHNAPEKLHAPTPAADRLHSTARPTCRELGEAGDSMVSKKPPSAFPVQPLVSGAGVDASAANGAAFKPLAAGPPGCRRKVPGPPARRRHTPGGGALAEYSRAARPATRRWRPNPPTASTAGRSPRARPARTAGPASQRRAPS